MDQRHSTSGGDGTDNLGQWDRHADRKPGV